MEATSIRELPPSRLDIEDLFPNEMPKAPEKMNQLPTLGTAKANEDAASLVQWYADNKARFTMWALLAENVKVIAEMRESHVKSAVNEIKHPSGKHAITKQKIALFDQMVVKLNKLFHVCKEQFDVIRVAEECFSSTREGLVQIKNGHESVPRDDGPCNESELADLFSKVDMCIMVLRSFASRTQGSYLTSSRMCKAEAALKSFQNTVDGFIDSSRVGMFGTTLRLDMDSLKKKAELTEQQPVEEES